MFTIDQVKAAHAKVKSGAGFPAYVQDIIRLGVVSYTTYVQDGNTIYNGSDGYTVASGPKYAAMAIADSSNKSQFTEDLKAHQEGKTDFLTFCSQSAESGIEKWVVDTIQLTCTYYDKAGKEILVEKIPVA